MNVKRTLWRKAKRTWSEMTGIERYCLLGTTICFALIILAWR